MSEIKEISSTCFPLMYVPRSKYIHRERHSGRVGYKDESRQSAYWLPSLPHLRHVTDTGYSGAM